MSLHRNYICKPFVTRAAALCLSLLMCMLAGCTAVSPSVDHPSGETHTEGTSTETQTATETSGESATESATETDTAVDTDTEISTDSNTESTTDGITDTDTDTNTEAESETPPAQLHPGDASAYKGLLISSVYGTGNKTDAVMEAGYVQLYNTTDAPLSLDGAALYYKTDGGSPYATFRFPADAAVPPKGYYLVVTKSVPNYDRSMAVLGLEHYDATWDVSFDNKEIRLLLAPAGWTVRTQDDILSFTDAISVFVATAAYKNSVYAVDDLSKNKIAVRTALTDYSGYHTVNLTRRATAELEQAVTRTSDGRVNKVLSTRLDEVYFSHAAGFYDTAVDLEMRAADGYTVYYTLDGSDPVTNGKAYTQSILLRNSSTMPWGPVTRAWNAFISAGSDGSGANYGWSPVPAVSSQIGGYVVKAYATDGTNRTPVYTNTYFINPDMADYNVSVVSISLPVTDMIGKNGFYSSFMPTGYMTDPRPRGTGMMEVFSSDGTRQGHSMVEMAVSGNGSSHGGMKSLRIFYKGSMNETGGLESNLDYDVFGGRAVDAYGQAITSFDRLILRNSGNDSSWSHFRDAYMQRISAGLNIDTQAAAPALVFINGEFWGVYNIRERYTTSYVENHYGVNKDNVTIIESDYHALVYRGNPSAPYVDTDGVPGQAAVFNELYNYIMTHEMSDPACYAYVTERMDTASFIDLWAVRLFLNCRDWPENNVKVWRNTNPDDPSGMDTKWHFVLLDLDMGMSYYPTADPNADTSASSQALFRAAVGADTVCSNIMRSLLKNSSFRQAFILRYYELANEHFTRSYMTDVLNEMMAEREILMPLQYGRWPGDGASKSRYNQSVDLMSRFIRDRYRYALDHFYLFFKTSESEIQSWSSRDVAVSFDPSRVTVTVNGQAVTSGTLLRDMGQNTLTVVATPVKDATVTAIQWIPSIGQPLTYQGNSVICNVDSSGAFVIHARDPGEIIPSSDGTIYAGASYMFYLAPNGDLYAWGDNRHGVLGLNLNVDVIPSPTFVMGNVAKVATSRGTDYEDGCTEWMTAILTKDHRLYTVGINTCGQLGRNGTDDDDRLGLVPFNSVVTDVSVGHDHTLILDGNGVLWGIGSNSNGQLGSWGLGGTVTSFCRIADKVTDMTAGRRSTAYLTSDAKLLALGDNRWYKMTSATSSQNLSTPTLMLNNVSYIASGEHQMIAVNAEGRLYYAGWRRFSTFEDRIGNATSPYNVMGGVVKADIFFSDMVILTDKGEAYVYGLNNQGCIGSKTLERKPQKLIDGVSDVAAGYGFTAYLMQDGTIKILGNNAYGQAGNGTVGGTVELTDVEFT